MSVDLERLKRAIARVTAVGEGRETTGTAFHVGSGFAVTALHVVADTAERPPRFAGSIRVHFYAAAKGCEAGVVPGFWSVEGDWVVLECGTAPEADAIDLGAGPAAGDEWVAFGFPEIRPGGMTMGGKVRDPCLRPQPEDEEVPPGEPVLQLLGDEPSAGMGARLHGFSGAPCLVGGKAAGILRSTLIEEILDGQLERRLFTQAGTLYATPARAVTDWQADRRRPLLPGAWAPAAIVTEQFLVLLSAQEPSGEPQAVRPGQLALRHVVQQAHRRLRASGLGPPCFLNAADQVASEQRLLQCVRALCGARVVVFDATGFEPAIMFLAGIRAVARRGVTLLSVGGDYALGTELAIPFNVQDANIVAHSLRQNQSPVADSVSLLVGRIQRGLREIDSAQYLDLPVYDAIRRLPADRRGIIPSEDGVLVLCPFDALYEPFWQARLLPALKNELDTLRGDRELQGSPSLGVSRSFELNSPRLVTQAVFEAIRRVQSCVVDLSGWSANVLFELGVRVAASGHRTACIIEQDWEQKLPRDEWARQCASLASMFLEPHFRYRADVPWEGQDVFKHAYGLDAATPRSDLLTGGLHALLARAIDVESEPASRPVYLELMDQAALYSRDPGPGGRSKPVGLFPGNAELVRREALAEFEHLLGAWLYVVHRYPVSELLEDDTARDAAYEIAQTLFERHESRLTDDLRNALSEMWDRIDDWRLEHGEPGAR